MVFKVSKNALSAFFDGEILEISTGILLRKWRLVEHGLATVLLSNLTVGQNIVDKPDNQIADWELFAITSGNNTCVVQDVAYEIVPETSYIAEHLLIRFYLYIEKQDLELCYSIMAFSGIGGVRTQLSCKVKNEYEPGRYPGWLLESYTERLPVETQSYARHLAGYYNDTQHRYHKDLSILKEETHLGMVSNCDVYDWANLIALENVSGSGVVLLKESHKCVNQSGVDTGSFKVFSACVVSTGLGLKSHYEDPLSFNDKEFRRCWANWCLVYNGKILGRQTVVKEFDAKRFKFSFQRDGTITSNTWGSRCSGDYSRKAANETDVLAEIDRAAKLGIDCVQIDDGWQVEDGELTPHNPALGWHPAISRFPNGWNVVREYAKKVGVKLGIWFPNYVSFDEMVENIRRGDFKQVKLDFINATSRQALMAVYQKAKAISELASDIQVNIDLTEQNPRFGYYFAREYCTLFPQNIEMCKQGKMGSRHIIYEPYLSLRQSWHFSKYLNLRKMQLSLQNVDDILPDFSDAAKYSHAYCFATAMMGLALLFLETKFYSDRAIDQLAPIIDLFRNCRQDIYQGTVYPIGDEPDNASITGFQSHLGNIGYVLVFRELNAPPSDSICVNFLSGNRIILKDMVRKTEKEISIDQGGQLPVDLNSPASWQLLRYEHIKTL